MTTNLQSFSKFLSRNPSLAFNSLALPNSSRASCLWRATGVDRGESKWGVSEVNGPIMWNVIASFGSSTSRIFMRGLGRGPRGNCKEKNETGTKRFI